MLATDCIASRSGHSQHADAKSAVAELHEQIRQSDPALILFFCSPTYDMKSLAEAVNENFGDTPVIGCTTMGEITPAGYLTRGITGVSLGASDFTISSQLVPNVRDLGFDEGTRLTESVVAGLREHEPDSTGQNTFGFLLIDGLSQREEAALAVLKPGLGDIPLFGGSAGDNLNFQETLVFSSGAFHSGAAVLTLIRTDCPFEVFKTQHFEATEEKVVVTGADSSRRVVSEINGEPATLEYARITGIDEADLSPTAFANHPVMVRIGGEYYVRSIMRANEDHTINFACAIDEGLVLTLATPVDIISNLEKLFDRLRRKIGPPQLVLSCDCGLRMIEMEERGIKDAVGEVMKRNHAVGFATYGEQFQALHVNQTLTGVAIGGRRRAS